MKKFRISLSMLLCFFLLLGYTPVNAESNTGYEETVFNFVDTPSEDLEYRIENNMARTWPGYSLRNFRVVKHTTLTSIIRSASLVAAGSHTLKVSKTHTTTGKVGAAFGIADVNIALDVSKTSSVTVEDTFSYTCPTTHNGRKVTRCQVNYKPQTTTYNYDEYFLEMKNSTWSADVLTGIVQQVTFYY